MHIYLPPLIGGAIIGLSASILWLGSGRVAGISGIISGIFQAQPTQYIHRLLFLFGLLIGGITLLFAYPTSIHVPIPRSIPALVIAGLLVGIGTKIGSGCTSGHGVCGISKLSTRSIIATLSFMAAGFLIATLLAGRSI
ncbi:MAG: YeeE/YedE family protein [Deltaproteobacteria bacterium]|nr:YeeE/YedE family protein [Deltaproteobacteria bacterium]